MHLPQPLARCARPCPTSRRVTEAAPPRGSPPRQQESQPAGGVWHRQGQQPGPGCPVPLTAEPCELLGARVAVPRGGWVLGLVAKQLFQRLLGPLESSRAWSLLEHAPAPGAALWPAGPRGLGLPGPRPPRSTWGPEVGEPVSAFPLTRLTATLPPRTASCPPLADPATQLPSGWAPAGPPPPPPPAFSGLPGPPQTPGPPPVLWGDSAPRSW